MVMALALAVLFSPIMSLESSCKVSDSPGASVSQNITQIPLEVITDDIASLRAYAQEHNLKFRYVDSNGNEKQFAGVVNETPLYMVTHGESSGQSIAIQNLQAINQNQPRTTTVAVLVKLKTGVTMNDTALGGVISYLGGTDLEPVFLSDSQFPSSSPLHKWGRTTFKSEEKAAEAIKILQNNSNILIAEKELSIVPF